jgi:hypothetical protein
MGLFLKRKALFSDSRFPLFYLATLRDRSAAFSLLGPRHVSVLDDFGVYLLNFARGALDVTSGP